jgi:DNA modification methylase
VKRGRGVEFRSRLEDLVPAEELVFPASPGFGPYKSIMPPEAVAHPAKFNVHLVEFLVDRYTKPGDIVLDPMAGTGILGVIAALRGRNAIQVEIEPRFYEWMERARQNVEKTPTLGRKGWIVNILGDARRLSELLRRVDAIMTSPPYGDTYLGGGDPAKRAERLIKAGHDPSEFLGGRARNAVLRHYSDMDAVITSPQYAETISHKSGGPTGVRKVGISTITARTYSTSNDNIGNLPLGNIDTIITSQPYAETLSINSGGMKGLKNAPKPGSVGKDGNSQLYSDNPDNIGNLPLGIVDAAITSPPYESALEGTSRHTRGGIASRDPKLAQSGTYSTVLSSKPGVPVMYSPNPDNIGNLKSSDEEYELVERERDLESLYRRLLKNGKPTYLSEMLKVYSEMYKVLKPGGYCVVVVKPFIRNKRVIDLPYYTWLLMERVGFKLVKLYKFRLPTKSFWRILYYRRFPTVPELAHEYVIVAVKVSSNER